jgi:hypothetical protein
MSTDVVVFAGFGLAMQIALVAFFGVRRWWPRHAGPVGPVVYALGASGVAVGVWLLANGGGWRLAVGPFLTAVWAVFGAAVDLWRPMPWRGRPIIWSVLIPYVGLYFFSQMWMWWPLLDLAQTAWVAYLLLFVANTTLNIREHAGIGSAPPG